MELKGLGKSAFITIISFIYGPVTTDNERTPEKIILTHYYKGTTRVATFKDRYKSGCIEIIPELTVFKECK